MPIVLPRGAARLRRGSRFVKGALAIVAASSDRNLVTGRTLTNGNGSRGKVTTPQGIASPFRNDGVMQTEVLAAIGTQTVVHVWAGTPRQRGSNGDGGRSGGFLLGSSTNDVGISGKGQWDGYAWSDQWGALWDWGGQGDSGKIVPSGELLPLNRPCVLVTIRRGTTIEMWRDGVLIARVANKDIKSYAASTMILGGFVDGNYWYNANDSVLGARILADWSPQDVREFSADPFAAFLEPMQGFNWAMLAQEAAPGIDLAVAPGVSQPQGASVAITQTHQLVAAPGLSQVALGVGAVVQSHVLAAAGGISQPAAASVAIGQAHALVAVAGVSQPVGSAVAVSQVHVLAGAPGTSTPVGPSVSIGTAGQLLAAPGVSQPVGGSVAITQVHVLVVSPGTSTPSGASVAITQAHRLAAAPGAPLAMAGTVAIVQRHVLAAALGTAQPVGPSVSLSTESNFEASIWRKYRVPAEARTFKIAAEQRKFGVTDG